MRALRGAELRSLHAAVGQRGIGAAFRPFPPGLSGRALAAHCAVRIRARRIPQLACGGMRLLAARRFAQSWFRSFSRARDDSTYAAPRAVRREDSVDACRTGSRTWIADRRLPADQSAHPGRLSRTGAPLDARFPVGRVTAVSPETADAATLTLRPGRGHWRTYSLTSVPGREDGFLTITVKAVPDGTVSPRPAHRTLPDTVLRLCPTQGEFAPPDQPPPRILMVTAGSGCRVLFTRTGAESTADATTPLLVVGESAGVAMPYGCRRGICFGCLTPPDVRPRTRPAYR